MVWPLEEGGEVIGVRSDDNAAAGVAPECGEGGL